MHGNVPSICNIHFGIIKSEVILGISVRIFYIFSDKLSFLTSVRRLIPLFANKKKNLIRIELTFYGKFQLLSE